MGGTAKKLKLGNFLSMVMLWLMESKLFSNIMAVPIIRVRDVKMCESTEMKKRENFSSKIFKIRPWLKQRLASGTPKSVKQ